MPTDYDTRKGRSGCEEKPKSIADGPRKGRYNPSGVGNKARNLNAYIFLISLRLNRDMNSQTKTGAV